MKKMHAGHAKVTPHSPGWSAVQSLLWRFCVAEHTCSKAKATKPRAVTNAANAYPASTNAKDERSKKNDGETIEGETIEREALGAPRAAAAGTPRRRRGRQEVLAGRGTAAPEALRRAHPQDHERGQMMSDKKRDEDVFDRVRREVREKEEKEAERMRQFDELLGRKGQQDELSKKLGR